MKKRLTLNDFTGQINKHLSSTLFGFFDLDTYQTENGVTRFQGILFYKETNGNDKIYINNPINYNVKPDYTVEIDILKKCKNYKIDVYKKDDLTYITWTIWFEKPFRNNYI